MTTRVRLKLGDVFEVDLGDGKVGYFQYLADDESMLDSYVIRAFRELHEVGSSPAMADVVAGEVHFHAHVFLKVGLKLDLWRKVGHAPAPGRVDVLFRSTDDYGNPEIKVSHRWYVWRINEPVRHVGVLAPEHQHAEFGPVIAPAAIVTRMRTGSYGIVYPGF